MESQRAATAEAILLNHRKLMRQKCVRKEQQQIDAASGRYLQTDGIDASKFWIIWLIFDNLANLENLENFEALF